MLWPILAAAAIVFWLQVIRWKNKKLRKMYNQLKSDKLSTLPILGHIHHFFGSDEDRMTAIQKFGLEAINNDGVTVMSRMGSIDIFVADPKIAELFLRTCLEKGDVMQILRVATGDTILIAPVHIWRPRRKMLAPSFNMKNLNQFVEIFSRQSCILVEQLRPVARAGPFSVWNYYTSYTLDSFCATLLDVQMHSQRDHSTPLLKAIDEATMLLGARLLQPWLYNDTVYKLSPAYQKLKKNLDSGKRFMEQVIKSKLKDAKQEIREMRKSNVGEKVKHESMKTLVELITEPPGEDWRLSDNDLIEEIELLSVAAIHTSAIASGFATVLLSKHTDVQIKVYAELKEVFGDSTRPLVKEDLLRLKYLDAVIKETLRMYPPVPTITRKVEKELTLPSGTVVPSGCSVVINLWALHRNPHYWGADADLFRPERFLNETLAHPAQFMPFSSGIRNCIGYQYSMLSMKTMLATLLRHYHVQPASLLPADPDEASAQSVPDKDMPLRTKFHVFMKDVDNYVVQLEPRI